MQPSSYSDVIRRIRELEPFTDHGHAAAALSETLVALAGLLGLETRRALAVALPTSLAQELRFDAQTARAPSSLGRR
jgi:hypothetical protein